MKRINLQSRINLLGIALIFATISCTDFREEAWNNREKYADTASITLQTDVATLTKRLTFADNETVSAFALKRVTPQIRN